MDTAPGLTPTTPVSVAHGGDGARNVRAMATTILVPLVCRIPADKIDVGKILMGRVDTRVDDAHQASPNHRERPGPHARPGLHPTERAP